MLYRTTIPAPVFGLRREIDRLFEDTFGAREDGGSWMPTVDVREDENELHFSFELPGLRPEEVEVTADNGVLTVRGEKKGKRKEGEGRYHLVERTYGAFMRSFQLPQTVDAEQIEAEFAHGVLDVRVPKAQRPQPRKIQVRTTQDVGAGPTAKEVGSGIHQSASGNTGSSGGSGKGMARTANAENRNGHSAEAKKS